MRQQRKNIVLLMSLVGLITIATVLYFVNNDAPAAIDPTRFQLRDSKAVSKVVFTRDTVQLTLAFINGRWMVNNAHQADRGLVDVLFATMLKAVPKRAVANALGDSIFREGKTRGIKTEFYVGTALDKTLWVWGDADRELTYFIDDQEDIPYVMTIPGYRVFVGGIFVQSAGTWRDKRIFNFNWRNFTSLEATFPNDPKQNFKAAFTDRFFSIEGLNPVDTTVLNDYLDGVSLIRADEFYTIGTSAKWDSLSQTKPIMQLLVTEASGHVHALQLFGIGRGEPRALAQWGNDYVWFDRRNILQLYKKRKDFVKQ
jgi:hypothetical protein